MTRFRDALRSGSTAIGPFDRFDNAAERTHVAGQVPPQPRNFPEGPWNRLSNSDRFALFSAQEAVEQAGISTPLDDRAGVFFGSSTGGLFETELYFEALLRCPASRPPRALLASHSLSSPAETVARRLGARGPVETVSSACASGGLAIEQALRALRTGEVDLAIAGGADCLCRTTYSGFNSLRAVDERPCRPFRVDRAGMSLGEGGAALVLESVEHARSRKAVALAEILGAGSSCDANHMTAPHAEGVWAASAIERALEDSGIDPDEVDLVNAHGTGTLLNDDAEHAALLRVFGERTRCIPLEVTKAVVGHLLGAAGVIEAVATVLSLLSKEVHSAPGGGEIRYAEFAGLALEGTRRMPDMRTAVSASFGFGGANAAVVLRRWEES
ncbi:MAG TPA: beta-ketoacyl-[acyl-carrier-protein] synthase family protein [Thermoanaerobaculia bacterium]|nr:beta-ketoacyl-[acyl-carrier-protein] synthase family protein [Thermoanaerobaculia bacterium]